MQENHIIQRNPFGLNIALPKKSFEDVKKAAKKELENITVNPFIDYFAENDKVFSGEVAGQIKKYQAQIYSLGQIMREGQPRTTFKMDM